MYTPSQEELKALLEIIAKLSHADSHRASRRDISADLLRLLHADYLASYIWNPHSGRFEDCVALNIEPAHLDRYERHFQHCDPISPRVRQQRGAAIVSDLIGQHELERTEFFNDFLIVAGMHHGIDMHLFDGDKHVGDLRIWRERGRPEFGSREVVLLETLRPYLIGTLRRLHELDRERSKARGWKTLWMHHPHASFIMDSQNNETYRNPSAIRLAARLSPKQKDALPALLREARDKPIEEKLWSDFLITVSTRDQSECEDNGVAYMVQIAPKKSPALPASELRTMFDLTRREADVCALVLPGFTDKDIAKALSISFPTVRTHLNHSFSKCGVTNRAELIHWIATNAK